VRGRTLGGVVNLFLQLKVSDENGNKIMPIDFSSFKIQSLSCCYNTQLKFGRTIANLVAHLTPLIVWQKDQYSSKYGFPKFVFLTIDLVLRVSVGHNLVYVYLAFKH
jgi:hypothetical protein